MSCVCAGVGRAGSCGSVTPFGKTRKEKEKKGGGRQKEPGAEEGNFDKTVPVKKHVENS